MSVYLIVAETLIQHSSFTLSLQLSNQPSSTYLFYRKIEPRANLHDQYERRSNWKVQKQQQQVLSFPQYRVWCQIIQQQAFANQKKTPSRRVNNSGANLKSSPLLAGTLDLNLQTGELVGTQTPVGTVIPQYWKLKQQLQLVPKASLVHADQTPVADVKQQLKSRPRELRSQLEVQGVVNDPPERVVVMTEPLQVLQYVRPSSHPKPQMSLQTLVFSPFIHSPVPQKPPEESIKHCPIQKEVERDGPHDVLSAHNSWLIAPLIVQQRFARQPEVCVHVPQFMVTQNIALPCPKIISIDPMKIVENKDIQNKYKATQSNQQQIDNKSLATKVYPKIYQSVGVFCFLTH